MLARDPPGKPELRWAIGESRFLMRRSCAVNAVRRGAVFGAGLLVVAATAVLAGAGPAAAATSTLTKTAQNASHPGAIPVGHGDAVNWTLSYTNSGSAPSAATITDPITGPQTYLPGSLRVPPGWTPAWSTDGSTFQGSEPGSGVVAVRASDPAARPGGTSVAGPLLPPVAATTTATGGDGFSPILHRRADGGVEAWNMYHHTAPATPKLVCTDLNAGALCAGGPWPKPVNTAPGPFGSGATGDVQSPMAPQYVADPGNPDVVFYAGSTTASVGVGCLDLAARANCGFVPLAATGGSPSSVNGLTGLVAVGGNAYGVDTTGRVLCLVLASRAPCAGQPYPAIVPGNGDTPGAGLTNYVGAMAVAGGKVFASSSTGPSLGCFDPATGAACAGWSSARPVAGGGATYNAFTAFDTSGAAVGACATSTGSATSTCYSLAGGSLPAPAFGYSATGVLAFAPTAVSGPDGHLRSYLPIWGGGYPGNTACYDWTAAATCVGFAAPVGHPTVNGGATRDYGYAYDGTTRCLFGLGDAGVLFSEDPVGGGSPCLHSGAEVTLSPSAFYCDGAGGHVRGYRDVRLDGITVSDVDLAASSLTVADPGGAVFASPAFAPDGSADLSGIPVSAHPSVVVGAHLVLRNGSDFTGGNRPNLVASFDGDAPQVCFRTVVPATCAVTSVSDTAGGSDGTGSFTSNAVGVPVAPGPSCQPKVSVDKEICASKVDADCGPGGAGPWSKQVPATIFGLITPRPHWRIAVTDAGPVGITGATLDDQAEPACAAAAGTFDLAAGATAYVYCTTTTVTLSQLPMTNTASVSYLPVNSPPGTPRGTSGSSSATACSILCY